jgi:hypothetical protein
MNKNADLKLPPIDAHKPPTVKSFGGKKPSGIGSGLGKTSKLSKEQ